MVQSFKARRVLASALIALLCGSALLSSGCKDCTADYCNGPLNIIVDADLIPEDAAVEIVVKGKVLPCTTDYSSSAPCRLLGPNESFYRGGRRHYEIKSMPKRVSVRIVTPEGDVIATYDETPQYMTGNVHSCSTACHKNATVVIGDDAAP